LKQTKIKLRWQIFAFVLIFAGMVIFIFCFFQIFMLDYFYRQNKINSAGDVVDEAISILKEDANYSVKLNELARNTDCSIYIINTDKTKQQYNQVYSGPTDYYNLICNNIDTINTNTTKDKFYITFRYPIQSQLYQGPLMDKKNIKLSDDADIICCRFITTSNTSDKFLLVVDSYLTPLEPVVETMEEQLLVISLIVLVLSILVALIISEIISKPIKIMTNDANELAKGRRDIVFNGSGYSEIYELNSALNYAVNELNKTDTLQKELLANISHDLKTPLTLISGYAEMMKDIKDEITPENLSVIVDEANRLNVLVNDLLNLSRLQSKTATFNMTNFDLNNLIKSIVDREQAFHQKDGVSINFLCNNELNIYADEHKMEQVIYNFITNAINYSKEDKRIVIEEENIDNFIRVKIIDHGIGIKEEDLNVVWNRYYRVDKTHQRSTKGTGLGLAIVKEILEYHGFKYGVESIYEKGSTFYFDIPIVNNESVNK